MLKINYEQTNKRNRIKQDKPYVYQKMLKMNDKLKNGQSIAIIQFQYNYICNFKCKHCSIKKFQGSFQNKRKFKIEDVKQLSRQADEMGLARFVITGGQPLIFPDLKQLVQAIDPKKFYINVDTNGFFLNQKKIKFLKQIGVDRVQISIDSLYPEQHDVFRMVNGAHKRCMDAVDLCIENDLDLFVQTVVTKSRLHSDEFLKFVNYFNDKGVTVFITYAKPVGQWQGHFEQLVDKDDMEYVKQLQKTYNICTHLTPAYQRDMGCIAVKGMISVTEYGDVLPCPYIHTSIGNVFEESLQTIIDRGLSIKQFGQFEKTCLIAEDRNFINKYVAGRIYDKQLPVPCDQVFTEQDKTVKPFNETMIQTGRI